jgi:hypothetical protein
MSLKQKYTKIALNSIETPIFKTNINIIFTLFDEQLNCTQIILIYFVDIYLFLLFKNQPKVKIVKNLESEQALIFFC